MHIQLVRNKNELEGFKKKVLMKLRVLLLEGTHSEENLLYKNNPQNPTRGIESLLKCFYDMKLKFKLIESTDPNVFNEFKNVDFVFPCAHGEYGEDGRLQGVMDYFSLQYLGSGVLGSAICADKLTFKRVITQAGIPTARYSEIYNNNEQSEILSLADDIGYPLMIKLRNGGSSIGLYKINNEDELISWLSCEGNIKNYFFEKFIPGRVITVGIIDTINGIRHLPLLEIKTDAEFYDESVKLGTNDSLRASFIVNPELQESDTKKILNASYKAFNICNCQSVVRIDFVVNDFLGPVMLEINTIPGVAENSNMTAMFHSLGYSYEEMIIELFKSGFHKR